MEEVKRNRPEKKKSSGRGTDFSLRILALVAAIISWFVLSITQYPTINKTITGVPVDFSLEDTQAQEKGLAALNYKDITVDVEIKGMNYEIGGYTANDLSATVKLDEVTKEGTYKLDIDVKSTHAADRCTVVSVTPQTVEVDFDRITTKKFEVVPEAPLITADSGYTLKDASVSPSEVTIEGPKNELDNINKVTARISQSKKIKEDITLSTDELIFYDADDNKMDDSKLSPTDETQFDINFVVYKKKTLNLKVDISGCPKNFNLDSLPMTMSENSLSVISPNLEGNETEDVVVGTIPLSGINLAKAFEFTIPIPQEEVNLNGTDTVKVTFDGKGYTSREFTVEADKISLINRPAGMTSNLETKKLSGIVIYGPEDVVEKLKNEDIYAQVDLSGIYEEGSYTRSAVIYAPDYDNVWCYGTNTVQVVTKTTRSTEND